jgi:hypothetical protein
MLSLFPGLLFLSPFAAFLIRVALAATLGASAYRHFCLRANVYLLALTALEIVFGGMLLVGFYTQAIALTALVLFLTSLIVPPVRTLPRSTLALAAVMCLTLLLTGPGPFAVDLPL